MSNDYNVQFQSGNIKRNNHNNINGQGAVFSSTEDGYTYKDMLGMMMGSKENMEAQKDYKQNSKNTSADKSVANGQSYLDIISGNYKSANNESKHIQMGDINEDGIIDEQDKDLLRKYFLGDVKDINWQLGDFSGDGKITAQDLANISELIELEKMKLSNLVYTEDNISLNFDNIIDNKRHNESDINNMAFNQMFPSIKYLKKPNGLSYNISVKLEGDVLNIIAGVGSMPSSRELEVREIGNGDIQVKWADIEIIVNSNVNYIDFSHCGTCDNFYESVDKRIEYTRLRDKYNNTTAINIEEPVNVIDKLSDEKIIFNKIEEIIDGQILYEDHPNGTKILNNGDSIKIFGWENNNIIDINKIELYPSGSNVDIYNATLPICIEDTEYANIQGSATIKTIYGNMFIDCDSFTKINTKENNIKVNVNGHNNQIALEGDKNIAVLSGSNNNIDILGKNATIDISGMNNKVCVLNTDALIKCGEGEDNIHVNALRTVIYNFDSDSDEVSLKLYDKILEVRQVGNHVMVKGINDSPNDFIVSFLECTDIDKIQKIVDKHNNTIIEDNDRLKRALNISFDEKLHTFPSSTNSVSFTKTGDINITNIRTSEVNNGMMKVDMDIYNHSAIPGVMQIVDSSGNVIGQMWLEEYDSAPSSASDLTVKLTTSTVDFGINIFQFIKGIENVTFDDASSSRWTQVRGIEIPVGTHIRFTNNINECEDLMAYHIASSCLEGLFQVADFADITKNVDDKVIKKSLIEVVKDIAKDIAKEFSSNNIGEIAQAVATNIKENPQAVLQRIGYNISSNIVQNVTETAYNTITGFVAALAAPELALAVSISFSIADTTNILRAMSDANAYSNEKAIHYYFYKGKESQI